MSKQAASNTFTEGLITDLNPLTLPNNILTDCLNGTIITYNGKEFVLQNDMGNTVVDRASLPMGFVPLGVKEYNGIVYIVAYNPLEQRVQFGSFPSPDIDLDGNDFNPEDYELEGPKFQITDFYTLNKSHPEYVEDTSLPIDNAYLAGLESYELLLAQQNNNQVDNIPGYNNETPFNHMIWHDFNSLGQEDVELIPNKYDYWEMDTQDGWPKFSISQSEISEDFTSYEWLKLNGGDRFIIYYIDLLQDNAYSNVDEILKHYLSTNEELKLFRAEVYAVSSTGKRTKLDINPFEYKSTDVNLNILNGDLTENVKYNVFNGDSNSTIEIKIILEKPLVFSAKFKQIAAIPPTSVRFTTRSVAKGYMQIKGFKYSIKSIGVTLPPTPHLWGFFKYKQDALYENRTPKEEVRSYAELKDLPVGLYSYTLTPFTQFGYELSMVITGTFEVSDSLVLEEESLNLLGYTWLYTAPNTFNLSFDVAYEITTDETVTDAWLEIYDPWSNTSVIKDLTPDINSEVIYSNDFTFNNHTKTELFDETSFGGVPPATIVDNPKAKLPNRTLSYQLEKVAFPNGTNTLTKDKFYVMAIYYAVTNSLSGETYYRGLYRYFFTNDHFNSFIGTNTDFSNLIHPELLQKDVVLTKGLFELITPSSLLLTELGIKENTKIFDPFLQEFNVTTGYLKPSIRSLYAILPKEFFDNHYTNSAVSQEYYKTVSMHHTQVLNDNYDIATELGKINESIVEITLPSATTIVPDESLRIVTSLDGSTSGSQVLGLLSILNMSFNVQFFNNKFLLYSIMDNTNVYSNIVYDFTRSLNAIENDNYLYPFIFQCSKEIQEAVINAPSNTLHNSLSTSMVSLYNYPEGNLMPSRIMIKTPLLNGSISNEYLNGGYYTPDAIELTMMPELLGRAYGMVVQETFTSALGIWQTIEAMPWDPINQVKFQLAYTKALKSPTNTSASYLMNYFGEEGLMLLTAFPHIGQVAFGTTEHMSSLVLFAGGITDDPTTAPLSKKMYSYATSPTKYSYENDASSVKYSKTNIFKYNIRNDWAFKVYAPAISNNTVVLNENAFKDYINSKFDFATYNGGALLFPKLKLKANTNISVTAENTFLIGIAPGDLATPTQVTNALNDLLTHPYLNQSSKYEWVLNSLGEGLLFDKVLMSIDGPVKNFLTLVKRTVSPIINWCIFDTTLWGVKFRPHDLLWADRPDHESPDPNALRAFVDYSGNPIVPETLINIYKV